VICDVEVRGAGARGQGVFALRRFTEGEFIFRRRYRQVVYNTELLALPAEAQRHLCELDFERSAVLLAPGWYLNHSCEPNAIRHGVNVFAWDAIEPDEEITIDYRLNAFDDDCTWICLCGAASCTGVVVNSFFTMSPRRQREYLPHAPSFIRREYAHRYRE